MKMGLWGKIKSVGEKALDITSSILLEPTTFIKSPTKAGALVKERRRKIRRGDKKEAVKVIAETLTATAIGAGAILGFGTAAGRVVVGKALTKLAPTTIPKAIGLATVGGVLLTSPKARKVAGGFIEDPTKIGRGAGEIIEGKEVGFIEALKTGGLIGAGVVTGVGAVKLIEKVKGIGGIGEIPTLAEKAVGITNGTSPILPQRQVVTPTRKAYKRRREIKTPSIRQSVRVNVIASPRASITNKRYLNERLLIC